MEFFLLSLISYLSSHSLLHPLLIILPIPLKSSRRLCLSRSMQFPNTCLKEIFASRGFSASSPNDKFCGKWKSIILLKFSSQPIARPPFHQNTFANRKEENVDVSFKWNDSDWSLVERINRERTKTGSRTTQQTWTRKSIVIKLPPDNQRYERSASVQIRRDANKVSKTVGNQSEMR